MVCMAHGLHNRCAFAAVQTLRLMLSCEDPNSTRCIAILISEAVRHSEVGCQRALRA